MQNETEASSPESQALDSERLKLRLAVSDLSLSLMEMNLVVEYLWPLIVSRFDDEDVTHVNRARRHLDSAYERAKGVGIAMSASDK
jgi:hypothetical protein